MDPFSGFAEALIPQRERKHSNELKSASKKEINSSRFSQLHQRTFMSLAQTARYS
jgi:hypothetical protein